MLSDEKVNILLVDDQPAKLLSYEAILSELGENLIKATSGSEALQQLLKTDIAVVLVDVCMPDLDGFELAEMIRQHPRHTKTAIIFVSAVHMSDVDRLKGYEAGAVDYVPVPVVPEILRARVGVFIELYRKTQQHERLNRELERRVAERTAELRESEGHLRQQTRELAAANGELEAFSYSISHDLQAPLRAIEGYSAMLLEDCLDQLDPEGKRYLTSIRRSVAQMHELLQSLLNFCRLGREGLTIEPVDMTRLAHSVVASLRNADPDSPTQVEFQRLAPAQADSKLLRQVLTNLIGNAWKFTREKPHPLIEVGSGERNGEQVYYVRDNGIGFDMQYCNKLFGVFERLQTSYDGAGVGLAIVKRIIERHGGRVWAEGEVGAGATFFFTLPQLLTSDSPPVPAPDTVELDKD